MAAVNIKDIASDFLEMNNVNEIKEDANRERCIKR